MCTNAAVAKLNFSGGAKSCMPSHCDNDQLDTDDGETSQDCGGECGCRASYEEIGFTGVPGAIDAIHILNMSGDARTLVGYAADPDASVTTVPITVSATSGAVTFLPNYGVYGTADLASQDGSLIVGGLDCEDPPDCTSGANLPFRWEDGGDPIKYPTWGVAAISATGNIVAFTNDSVVATRWVMSTGAYAYAEELSWVGGISADGKVVHAAADDNFDALWFAETDTIVNPAYPSEWGMGLIHSIDADGSVFVGHGLVWLTGGGTAMYPFISREGALEELDVPDGISNAIPQKVSSNGTVFIGGALDTDTSSNEAIIWDNAGGIRWLYDELVSRGLELPLDVILPSARLLSSNGRVIVLESTNLAPFTRIELLD